MGCADTTVEIKVGEITLHAFIEIPKDAKGMVVFAHGSGSSRYSPRNQYVANLFNQAHLATLLIDLLTEEEEQVDNITAEHRFNIPLLAERVVVASDWLLSNETTHNFKIGYIGSSTGAAAALIAAAKKAENTVAVVSRGGRPDLAEPFLSQVKAPTLLVVGANDFEVIKLNEQAYSQLNVEKELKLVPNATHLFEEPGTLEEAAQLACDWFATHF